MLYLKSFTSLREGALMVLYSSLCFSDYLEFSQFKRSITLKTIPFEGSCHNMYLHNVNLTAISQSLTTNWWDFKLLKQCFLVLQLEFTLKFVQSNPLPFTSKEMARITRSVLSDWLVTVLEQLDLDPSCYNLRHRV